MLSFKKIEQSDINELKKYYDYDECMGCDTNLLNAYLWRNEYNIKFAFYDDLNTACKSNSGKSISELISAKHYKEIVYNLIFFLVVSVKKQVYLSLIKYSFCCECWTNKFRKE